MGQALSMLTKAGPQVGKQLPKLWPLLLESKNRERLGEFFLDLANASPAKRLRARLELTAALAEEIAQSATGDAEKKQAEGWSHRARNLVRRLNMPVAGTGTKRAHRRSIREQLDALQPEMNTHLAETA
ncbi:hypothetical protein CFI00_08375 [Nocardioides sp. S5]|uniref:hypothetical protein n=1 Tax=Nocardioides sp. S5 TaxID=2017486 RepID=UPI001A8DDA9A|nr:hypothetical protein [Nocardioides sp. S5]QSR30519.1 hypothetical protein CFI00_08375 [Nocardioides sp. S5]